MQTVRCAETSFLQSSPVRAVVSADLRARFNGNVRFGSDADIGTGVGFGLLVPITDTFLPRATLPRVHLNVSRMGSAWPP